jgi:2-oxoisovalerate dehydrogenase E2 component (dihydrolipoyl transacylase)
MSIFNLPDLGEGLPDAEISEWFIKEGDSVTTDQPLVSMETAKAVVDVPSPQDGVIKKLYGKAGDIIITGASLIEFESQDEAEPDAGTVVGNIQSSGETITDDFIIGGTNKRQGHRIKATPKVKALARKLSVDLSSLTGSGPNNSISIHDVEAAAHPLAEGYEPLKGIRRHMVRTMTQSHNEVVAVSLFDDANLGEWDDQQDITVRLIQAICSAAKEEPALNAWYDGHNSASKIFDKVNLGLATDTPDGLFVPVISNACCLSAQELRTEINRYKQSVNDRSVLPEELNGASITLSNFGKFAGRYANPIIVPPSVAIIGVGRLRQAAVNDKGQVAIKPVLPISLSFDHRAITGGEATRFLGLILASLEKSTCS